MFVRFLRQISSFSRYFLETLTEMVSIHLVGVQTWLQSSHEGTGRLKKKGDVQIGQQRESFTHPVSSTVCKGKLGQGTV